MPSSERNFSLWTLKYADTIRAASFLAKADFRVRKKSLFNSQSIKLHSGVYLQKVSPISELDPEGLRHEDLREAPGGQRVRVRQGCPQPGGSKCFYPLDDITKMIGSSKY